MAGFAPYRRTLQLRAGQTLTLTATLPMAAHAEELSVAGDSSGGTDPAANRDALIFSADRLALLSDDDNTLRRQLLAFANEGDSGSAQIFIDGFSGGRFPPKDTIREIRINQNPFSAQYDRRGLGRIEVFTKPGGNTLHGSLRLSGNDKSFNALNPYTGPQPPYHSETLDAEVNGRLNAHTSFFLAASTADNQSNVPVNAVVLDANLAPSAISEAVPNPQTSQTYSLRLDRQLGEHNTLIARYEYNDAHLTNGGVGQLTLLSQGFRSDTATQTLQLGNTHISSDHLVSETRFQYIRTRLLQTANDTSPSLIVQGAFNGGGSPAQTLRDNQDAYEFQEYLSADHGKHFLRAGARYRILRDANVATANYNGQYIFSTLSAYQTTLRGLQGGLGPAAIRALGGGPTQFNLTAGTPSATVLVGDLGAYAEDEWKALPNVTLNLGVRLETETGIPDHFDPAPRLAVNWAISKHKGEPPLVILRGGGGLFFDRFAPGNLLQTLRQNGVSQRPYFVESPDFYPSIPDPSTLPGIAPTTYLLDARFRSTYAFVGALTAEHTWSRYGSVTAGFNEIHALHLPVSLNINAPLPGTFNPAVPGSGSRPFGGTRAIYQYTSEGINNAQSFYSTANLRPTAHSSLFALYQAQWRTTDVSGANNFPSDSYNLRADLGRSNFLLHHRFYLGANADLPWGFTSGLTLSARSGPPFNITTGQDFNGDTQFNDRPAFATDLTRPSVVKTPFGNFDTSPLPAQTIIPINYGNAPAYISLRAQAGKTFGIGPHVSTLAANGQTATAKAKRKYQLGFSVEASNVLNHNNPAQPIGVLSSPFFGRSIALQSDDFDLTSANRYIQLFATFRF